MTGSLEGRRDFVRQSAEMVLTVLMRNPTAADGSGWWLCHRISAAISLENLQNRKKKGHIYYDNMIREGHAVAHLVEALRYKLKGHGFDSRWCHWNFSLT